MEKIIPAAEEGFAAFISRIFFLQGEGEDHPCSGGGLCWPNMDLCSLCCDDVSSLRRRRALISRT